MKSKIRGVRDLPLFPILPFAPIAVAGSLLAVSALTLLNVKRLARSLEHQARHRELE